MKIFFTVIWLICLLLGCGKFKDSNDKNSDKSNPTETPKTYSFADPVKVSCSPNIFEDDSPLASGTDIYFRGFDHINFCSTPYETTGLKNITSASNVKAIAVSENGVFIQKNKYVYFYPKDQIDNDNYVPEAVGPTSISNDPGETFKLYSARTDLVGLNRNGMTSFKKREKDDHDKYVWNVIHASYAGLNRGELSELGLFYFDQDSVEIKSNLLPGVLPSVIDKAKTFSCDDSPVIKSSEFTASDTGLFIQGKNEVCYFNKDFEQKVLVSDFAGQNLIKMEATSLGVFLNFYTDEGSQVDFVDLQGNRQKIASFIKYTPDMRVSEGGVFLFIDHLEGDSQFYQISEITSPRL